MPREYMIAHRKSLQLSVDRMAAKLQISPTLLSMLENDESCVTHPEFVKRIAKAYKLTKQQRTMMLPPNYRPGPDYNPNLYKPDTEWHEAIFDFGRKG